MMITIAQTEFRQKITASLAVILIAIIFTGNRLQADDRVSTPSPAADDAPELRLEVVPPSESEFVIDLGTALRLAETQNPRMALAREIVNEAIAQHKEARALLLPTLTAGSNYHLHTGALQTSFGEIRQVNSQSLYAGSGVGAIGTGTTTTPGVRIFAQLGDAYYLPLAAAQTVTARSYDSHAVDNLTLLDVADRYLNLVAAEARREAFAASLREMYQIEYDQKSFAVAGQGRDADFRRARAERQLIQLQEQQAQEDSAIASAELSRLLHLDPSIRLVTPTGPIEMLELVDQNSNVEDLVVRAMQQRPEVAARTADIGTVDFQLRNERVRPWLPVISAGFSGGAFGGGSDRADLGVPGTFYTMSGRTDLDLWAVWNVQNLGVGNRAWQSLRRAEREQAIVNRALILAAIRREVQERLSQIRAHNRAVNVSWVQLAAAERGAHEELIRTRSGDALPLESLNIVTRLSTARQQLLASVIDYNRAQLRLFVALGVSPTLLNTAAIESPPTPTTAE